MRIGSKIIIRIIMILLTICLCMGQIYAAGMRRLSDESVYGKDAAYDINHQNRNRIVETPSIGDASQRENLLLKSSESKKTEQFQEEGYVEDVSQRTVNSKTFQKGDVQQTVIYSDAIHYKSGEKLKDYNNDLQKPRTRSQTSVYQNTSGDHHYQFPETLSCDTDIHTDELMFRITDVNETNGKVQDDTIIYQNAKEGKDYSLTSCNTGVLVKSATADINHELTQTLSLHLTDQKIAQQTDDKTAVYIYEQGKPTYVVSAVALHDADGHVVDLYDLEIQLENDQITIQPTKEKLSQLTTAPYNMEVSVKSVTSQDHSLIKLYGIRSGDKYKNKSFAPEISSNYTHFAMVGRDPEGSINSGVTSPENVGLIKVDFDRLVKDYIGPYRRIEKASMSLRLATAIKNKSTLTMSRLNEKMPLFDNYNNLKWTKYNSYYQKYKDRNQSYSPVSLDTQTFTRETGTPQFINFDITDAIDYWYQGNPAYGLILEGDSADTKAQAIFNHASSNESRVLPYMTITHVKDGPVDPDLSLDATTLNIRPFTQSNGQGMLHFSALGFDGLARPNSDVMIQVVDTTNNQTVYNRTAHTASTYRVYPQYDKIPNAQQYFRKVSNYQTDQLLLSSSLSVHHLYQVKYKVISYDQDGHVKATKDWTNGETFQLYKVGGFDRVSRIMDFYGIKDNSLFRQDNHMFDSLLIQGNLLFMRNPTKNKNKAYTSKSLTVTDKKAIDMALQGRGLHCEYGYEPVNYNTGNLYYTNQDAYFMEYGEKYYFERSYNSLSEKTGLLGNNWDMNWNFQLSFTDNAALFSDGTGKILTFFKNGNSYTSPQGYQMTLQKEKVSEKVYYVDSDYYDQDETPIQEKVVVSIYDYIITNHEDHRIYRFNDEGYIKEVTLDQYGHKMSYTYDSNNHVTQMKTSSGKVFAFRYNTDHYLTRITMPNGTSIQFDYDNQGNMVTMTDQKGYQIHYGYQGKGLLKTYTSRESKKVILTNEFDSSGRVIKQTDAQNHTVTFQYTSGYTKITGYDGKSEYVYLDENKRTVKKVSPDGETTNNTYNAKNQLTSTVEDGQKKEYVYNNQGQLIHEIRSDGKKMTYAYSGNNLIKKTDFDNQTTSYEYDSKGHLTKTIYPDGTYTAQKYNDDGQMIFERDIYGLEKTYTYDKGNKVKETDQYEHTVHYTYDALGMINAQIDQENHQTTFVRDERGQKIRETTPSGTHHYKYDGDGNMVYEEDANGHGIYYTYDSLSRVISKRDAYGTTHTEYDAHGNILKTIDEGGYTKSYTYDTSGHKTSYTDENGNTEYYIYENNRLTQTKDIQGVITYYTYDSLGQLIKEQRLNKINTYQYNGKGQLIKKNENGVVTSFRYDDYGNMIYKETNGICEEYEYFYERLMSQTIKGAKTTYTYDVYGRKTSETNALDEKTTYRYSASGNLIEIIQPSGNKLTMTYDGNHQLLKTADSLGHVTSSKYDANGNMIKKTDENGYTTKYTYNARNQQTSVKDANGNMTTYEYNAKGQLIKTVNPLCQEITYTYTPNGQLKTTTDSLGRTTENIYDKVGHVVETVDVKGRSAYQFFDKDNHLISSRDVYGKEMRYTYDQYDRLIKTEDDDGHVKKTTYNDQDLPILESNERNQTIHYEYDHSGNLIKTTDIRGHETNMTYDKLGRMTKQKDIYGNITSVVYDHAGNMTSLTVDKNTTVYQYNIIGLLESETDAIGRTKSYVYDASGNVMKTTDPMGNETHYVYDKVGNLISVTNAKDQTTKYEYDALNRPYKQINPDLSFRLNVYDKAGRVIESINELGYSQKVEYNELNQEVKVIDERGYKTIYEYNHRDLLSKTIYPDGTSTTNEYNNKNQLIKNLDTQAHVHEYVYDDYGRKIKEIDPNGYFREYEYSHYDEMIHWKDNDGLLLTYEYDQYGRQISTVNKAGMTTHTTYDHHSNIIEETDIRGNVVKKDYDQMQRLIRETDVRGNKTEYTYDKQDRITDTRINDHVSHQEYDALGNIIQSIDVLGYETRYEYNDRNQLIKEINALNQATTYTYDIAGHLLSETNAKKHTKKYGYDEAGNRTKEVNEAGLEKLYQYNSMNQLTSMQTEDNIVIHYSYDESGNMTKVSLHDQVKYQFKYDRMNKLIEQKDADQRIESYTYYLNGNIKTQTDKQGNTLHYEYNDHNQIQKIDTDRIHIQFHYDEYGQLIKANRNGKISTFDYNQYGDVAKATDPHQQTVRYTYDEYGRQFKVYYPSETKVSYSYDALDHITEVKDDAQTTRYEYDALGREILSESSSQRKETIYDETGLVIESRTRHNDQDIIYQYEYDELGNTIKETSSYNHQKTVREMTYDNASQLIQSQITSGNDTKISHYTYDDFGNRILYEEEINDEKTMKHSHYNANDELLKDGKATYQYDKNGNVTEKVFEDGHTEKLFYNELNELVMMKNSDGKKVRYKYDALGNRIAKQEKIELESKDFINYLKADAKMADLQESIQTQDELNIRLDDKLKEYQDAFKQGLPEQTSTWLTEEGVDVKTIYVNDITYNHTQVLEQQQNKQIETYTYGNERISMTKDNKEIFNYIYDGKSNVVSEDGKNIYRYDDFGKSLQNINDAYAYSGENSEYRYQYLRARYYQTENGRFLSRDNYLGNQNAGEYNQYIYALNNPNKYKDPSGHFNIAEAFSVAFSIAKKEARKQIDYAVKTAGKTLDWVGNITGLKGTTSYIKKTINTQVKKVNKIMDKVVAQAQKNATAARKKSQQRQQKNNFISYAQKHGIEEAYRKYKGMDSRLLEEAVKAYCEKLGLEYISVADALKTVAKVEKGLSLLSKYTTICETIKHTGNVNEDAVKSSVGYSRESSINKVYLSKAVSLLNYTRNQASNYPHATGSVTSSVNARIGTIYSYSYGTSQLTSEYVSSMTSHSKDMMNYIWSENGEYRAVKVWVDTGRYSGGYFEKAVYHKDSKQYQAYGNWYYATLVPMYADAQAHADKLEFLAGIAGAANQSYNPYTGTVNHATNSQGPSTGNEIYRDTNSSIGNSTSPSGQVTQGNSTTNGYTEPGNTNPGYVPPSTSNGIGTGTVQGSGSDNLNPKNPMTGEEWNKYFKEAYGVGNVQWKPTSFQDIISNPQRLYGCTPNEINSILGDGWAYGTYGSNGQGWKFTSSKGSIFYHVGGGRHGGSYYGFSTGPTGKVKLVDDTYIYTVDDGATIIPRDK